MRAHAGDYAGLFEALEVHDKNRPEAEKRYRDFVLGSPEVLRRVMPRVHQLFSDKETVCAGCPGPKAFPEMPRSVSRSELMPYVVAYFWPVHVEPSGTVRIQICSGINGLDRIENRESALVAAAFDLAFGNFSAAGVASRVARQAARAAECDAAAAGERLSCVRDRLSRNLPLDADFGKALAPSFAMLPELGISCSDCEGLESGSGRAKAAPGR